MGGKHTPEEKLIKSKTKWLEADKVREFEKEYKQIVNEGIILRSKKMTGKGSDWHVSLNPRTLKELYEKLRQDLKKEEMKGEENEEKRNWSIL